MDLDSDLEPPERTVRSETMYTQTGELDERVGRRRPAVYAGREPS